jgi:zinc resistance-associated protein
MKTLITLTGIIFLGGLIAVPVMAWGPRWGGGHHMMGYWGNDTQYGQNTVNLTSEQKSRLEALDRKFYDETRELRDQIWAKSGELDATLNAADPDLEKAKTLQKEISEFRAALNEKALNYELEARKIVPEQRMGFGYGHRGAYGYGRGFGGYCWN